MGSRAKHALLCLTAALTLGAALPAASEAAQWVVSGHTLGEGESEVAGSEANKVTVAVKGLVNISCNLNVADKLIGGAKGTDEWTTLQLYGCSTNISGCTVEEASAKKLSYPSELLASGSKFFDLSKHLDVRFVLTGFCSVAGTYLLEEQVEAEFENSSESLRFPTTPFSGSDLVLNDLTTMKAFHAVLEGSVRLVAGSGKVEVK
jgi:hypothetical protein